MKYGGGLTLARFPYYATFASGRGLVGATLPPRVSKLRAVELSGKNSGLLSRDWWRVFFKSYVNI